MGCLTGSQYYAIASLSLIDRSKIRLIKVVMPTKCSDAQPLVNLKNNCSRKRSENRRMSCNSLWFPTLILWYKYEVRKFSHFVRFSFPIIKVFFFFLI